MWIFLAVATLLTCPVHGTGAAAGTAGTAGGGAGSGSDKTQTTDKLLAASLPLGYKAYLAEHGILLNTEGILTTADSQSHCFQLDIELDSFFHSVIPDCGAHPQTDYCHLTSLEQEHVQRAANNVRSAFRRSLQKEAPLVEVAGKVLQAMRSPSSTVTISNGQVCQMAHSSPIAFSK